MCVCLPRRKQNELSMFARHCWELSIVTGAESGLLLSPLKRGDEFDKQQGRKEEEKSKPRRAREIASLMQPQRLTADWMKFLGNLDCKRAADKL